ncbi:hypothetical protein IPA_07410 [Ignicoccus pacificus DSM 13166]|uniref:CRISPR-associated protein Cas6 C-terminal domain-containing protein n=1 Tax=Ignicoccus pacificus DSM 13166 TaxID=940294 RepID=A0A977KBQ2_9CREN|nr:hypothetical protein IPA_07410 [Ignicoccus pacificus DSM 13166]
MSHVFVVSVDVVATKPIKWRAWKGVFSGKVVYDSLKASGLEPTSSIRVSPPEKFKGALKPGDVVKFNAYFWGEGAEEEVAALVQGIGALEYVAPRSLEVKEVEIEEPEVRSSEEPKAVFFAVKHLPTYYRFHGAWVPLPSPSRMIYSLFRRLSEATNSSFSNEASLIATAIEAIGGRPSFARYRIHFDEEVPAFSGTIKYYGILPTNLADLLKWALKYLPYLGVGSSPGVGFGHVEEVKLAEPPFEAPVEPWEP